VLIVQTASSHKTSTSSSANSFYRHLFTYNTITKGSLLRTTLIQSATFGVFQIKGETENITKHSLPK